MEKQEQHIDYEALIVKRLAGEISASEQDQLMTWMNKSHTNQELYKGYEKTWFHTSFVHPKANINAEKEWQIFLKKRNKLGKKTPRLHYMQGPLVRIAAVFIAAILVASTVLYFYNKPVQYASNNTVLSIQLSDGSTVVLNKNSELQVHPFDKKGQREVHLKGEAFFEVKPNMQKPFVIHTHHMNVTVLGTAFRVSDAGRNASSAQVTVQSGSVSVTGENKKIELNAGDEGVFHVSSNKLTKQDISNPNYLSWKTHIFEFNDQPLDEVVSDLNAVYEKEIILKNEKLKNCRLTARFEKQSIQSVIQVLSSLLHVEIKEQNKTIEISGAGC